jgi:hypothetical protein
MPAGSGRPCMSYAGNTTKCTTVATTCGGRKCH